MTKEIINPSSTLFAEKLIDWYEIHKRELPWRNTKDPYTVWLSEIILQQTRVAQGLPYFQSFLNTYPTIYDFAGAEEKEILNLWQGLGYYSRARNMIECARTIVDEYDGRFPEGYAELVKLKGVGKYTAAAIASFCFNEVVPVIDGNVYRVLARIFGVEHDISRTDAYRVFHDKSKELIESEKPDVYNQAIMEFGALHCVPKSPDCSSCTFKSMCFAFDKDLQNALPVKTKKIKKRNRYFNYVVVVYKNNILLNHRKERDIWEGLYDFLNFELDTENMPEFKENGLFAQLNDGDNVVPIGQDYKHILTHQKINAKFFLLEVGHKETFNTIKDKFRLIDVSLDQIGSYPNPILIDKFLKSDFL